MTQVTVIATSPLVPEIREVRYIERKQGKNSAQRSACFYKVKKNSIFPLITFFWESL